MRTNTRWKRRTRAEREKRERNAFYAMERDPLYRPSPNLQIHTVRAWRASILEQRRHDEALRVAFPEGRGSVQNLSGGRIEFGDFLMLSHDLKYAVFPAPGDPIHAIARTAAKEGAMVEIMTSAYRPKGTRAPAP